ncbi:hypothetical protein [Aquimarina celericrescens]|uniref:Outer membrane protein beta-barrel domain-containing protein n=1 Tax=Aquimarina celericrescens TaxID=1964542 RepID=A0ABW5AXG0_9FLAO|nr:hypothetical protein [Aquimarina celericrescens]
MKVFRPEFFHNKNTTLKESLFLIIVALCLSNLNAQVQLRLEPGVLLETGSENLGVMLNIEPKVKASENTVIGLRFGIAINSQKFEIDDSTPFFIDDLDDNGMFSFVSTFDYYLNENYYRPYIGLGLGYYFFNNIDVSRRDGATDVLEGSVNNQLGLLLRGGLDLGNTRFGLEYNFITKADIEIPNGQIIGTVDNSYLGISIGFIIVGRKKQEKL